MASRPNMTFDWKRYEDQFAEMEARAAREAARYLPLLDHYDPVRLFDLFELPDDPQSEPID